MESLIVIFHIVVAVAIIGLVLVQQGKGAEAGASFGGGASQTVFGSSGSGNFLTRSTSVLAVIFFTTSFTLAYFAKEHAVGLNDEGLPALIESQADMTDAPLVKDSLPAGDAPVIE